MQKKMIKKKDEWNKLSMKNFLISTCLLVCMSVYNKQKQITFKTENQQPKNKTEKLLI